MTGLMLYGSHTHVDDAIPVITDSITVANPPWEASDPIREQTGGA